MLNKVLEVQVYKLLITFVKKFPQQQQVTAAYVIDNGVGEWALYLYDGSAWTKVSDEDSANTDAQTSTRNVTAPVGGFGNSTNYDLGNVTAVKYKVLVLMYIQHLLVANSKILQ